ncbi:MAG: hypothetical protein WC358_02760 [Ignavibacteria bacterium]|jgi:hypothetical protein
MGKFTGKFNFIVAIVITMALVLSCSKLKDIDKKDKEKEDVSKEETTKEETKKETKTSEAKLYFCEQYKNGEEIGVSKRFTPGWLTVMIDLRPAGKTLGTGKVELRISRIKDEDGNEISEKIIKTVPFSVQADWDYTYFEDHDNIKFKTPGTYKVVCQKVDGTPIVEGQVDVVSK